MFGQCEVKVPVRQLTGDVTLMTVGGYKSENSVKRSDCRGGSILTIPGI